MDSPRIYFAQNFRMQKKKQWTMCPTRLFDNFNESAISISHISGSCVIISWIFWCLSCMSTAYIILLMLNAHSEPLIIVCLAWCRVRITQIYFITNIFNKKKKKDHPNLKVYEFTRRKSLPTAAIKAQLQLY